MILEFIEFLRTRSNRLAKDWGYAYQNVSLKFRARRCAKAWQSHVDHCHGLIRAQLQEVKPQSVLILGSGILLEIPVEDLLKSCEKIYLVDLVHAPEVRKLARRHPQLELIEKDLSALLGLLKKGQAPFQPQSLPWGTLSSWDLPAVDWVISANLLSQLPLMISEALPMSAEVYKDFARRVRDQHVERLLKQGRRALLFADFETRYVDRSQNRIKTETYAVNLQSLKFMEEWTWEISPYGESSADYKVEMLVKAYSN
jgi:hypothetical protein